MANGKKPRSTGEHLISIYGYITGVKREVDTIRCNQKHIHEDIDNISSKVDKLLYLLIGALISGIVAIIDAYR